ncbi:hypothetical protein LGAA44_150061 [Leuconostoc gasicomitatum]|nr:hypothetical protein LGAA44_150061 [Leuconostoc gasicomitatum]
MLMLENIYIILLTAASLIQYGEWLDRMILKTFKRNFFMLLGANKATW